MLIVVCHFFEEQGVHLLGYFPSAFLSPLISVIGGACFLLACVVLPVCRWRSGSFERGASQDILSHAIHKNDNTKAAAAPVRQAVGQILKFS